MSTSQTSLILIQLILALSHSKRMYTTQPEITCSKLTIETLEQGVKYVQS